MGDSKDWKPPLEATTQLHPNYTNYVYVLPEEVDDDNWLIYNPSLHYWFATGQWGAALIKCIDGSTLSDVQDRMRAKFTSVVDQQTKSFLENLLSMGFLSLEKTSAELSWVSGTHDTDKDYHFDAMFISLGDSCNLDCPYCFNKTRRKTRLQNRRKDSINVPAIARAMKEFKEIGGQAVCFTGGEPTLFKGVLDVCAEAKRLGLATNMMTNGKRLNTLDAERLVDVLDGIDVSLDTTDEAVAEKLWGGRNHQIRTQILERLAHIVAVAEARDVEFRVTIKPIVSAVNLHTMAPLVEEVCQRIPGHRLFWDFSPFNPVGDNQIDSKLGVTEEQYIDTLLGCIKLIRPEIEHDRHEARRLALQRVRKKSPGKAMDISPCSPSFFIVPNGDVFPCQELEVEEFCVGNIENESLMQMFAKPAWKELRQHMTVDDLDVCRDCELRFVCARHCHGESFCESGDTTSFTGSDTTQCRNLVIEQLWLETRRFKGVHSK